MMSGLWIANFGILLGGLVMAVMGWIVILFIPYLDRWNRRFFSLLFSILVLYVASMLTFYLSVTLHGPEAAPVSTVSMYLQSLLSSLLLPMLTVYILHCCGEELKNSPLLFVVGILWLIYFVMLTSTLFTGQFFRVSAENKYSRGPWYPALLVPPMLFMLVNLAALWRRRKKLTNRQLAAFLCYILLPLAGMVTQILFFGLPLIELGSCIAAIIMQGFILSDQMKKHQAQQEESARQRASILMLQMRPHFIYNTMTSIYYLCGQDPLRAQQVTRDFTSYLRKNFTAMAGEGTILFTEELEHARAYLAVEQVRFEGKLYVEWDTPAVAFRIPPLTLQPIVENAVKHGVSPGLEPLYISVFTRETENGAEIVVEDSGPGYAPADDNEPHVALANIRERLAMLCGGTLTIEQRAAGGTRVTVFVPTRGGRKPTLETKKR